MGDNTSNSVRTAASTSLTPKEFGRRFRKAISVPFLLNQVCSTNVTEFVTSYATSLGCSEKCFFLPLLTCAAACMGNDCHIELSSLWHEPPIIWTLVISPRSLLRIDVAEHLKLELLKVQNEMWSHCEDTKDHLKKFVFDMFTFDQLHEMLKLSSGHGCAIYNSVRSLHKVMMQPEETDIMLRLHSGLGWFTDSRLSRGTLTKTRVNFSVISTPSIVQQTLNSAPNFQELFYHCFLTACSEENHAKFGQLSEAPETEKLREIFLSLIKLHCSGTPIVYKLSAEAKEKFGQIHDELTDKAKQMARKNAHKVFQPALSYLGRLSCVLHVLDNVIDAINYKLPISSLTWNTEVSASTVWQARELLGHIIEQRHALMEQTTIDVSQQRTQRAPAIDLVDGQTSPRIPRTPIIRTPHIQRTPQTMMTPPGHMIQRRTPMQNAVQKSPNFIPNNAKRNLMNNNRIRSPASNSFDSLLTQTSAPRTVDPLIVAVRSAGLPVGNKQTSITPITPVITSHEVVNNTSGTLNAELHLPPSLSVSVSEEVESAQPVLLSRTPYTTVLDVSDEDFLSSHRSAIKKLLMHGISQISPSRCVQLKLTPDPTASDEEQKYTSSFARSFLKKLETLGFGVCDGPKNGNLRHFTFKKKKYSALGDKQLQILADLKISERDYNKCFIVTPPQKTHQNGSVVCLE